MTSFKFASVATIALIASHLETNAGVVLYNRDYYETVNVSCAATTSCLVTFTANQDSGVYITAINCNLTTTLTMKKLEFSLFDGATKVYFRSFPASAMDNTNKVVMASFNDQMVIYNALRTPKFTITTTASGSITGTCVMSAFKGGNEPYSYYR